MKAQKTHIYTLKIHSSILEMYDWDYATTLNELRKDSRSVVSLNDSQVLRWIAQINGTEDSDIKAKSIKSDIQILKKEPPTKENKRKINQKYEELYRQRFLKDYISVIFDKKSHYDRALKGFSITIDGKKTVYKRLLGTPGSIKNSTIIFVNQDIHEKLMWHLNNGRDETKLLVPSKLEAYMALSCSGSVPVPFPRIIVVNDCITHAIIPEIIHLDYTDESIEEPVLEHRFNQEIEINGSDGFGLMTPEYSMRVNEALNGNGNEVVSFNTRFAFTKGMLVPFPIIEFAEHKANQNYYIQDAWGNLQDVRECDCILTVSMVKLWDSYKSCEDFVNNCKEHNFEFCAAKTAPHELQQRRTSNYQFLQGYTNFDDDDINELVKPTVDHIKDCLGMDWRKLLVYMCGKGLNEKTFKHADPIAKAIMICPEIINDTYVRSRIERMISKSIKDAKIGVLSLKGDYSIIVGDPYCLAESIFGLEKRGLLKSGEAYSQYWINNGTDKVVAFRAPMLVHYNTGMLNIVHNEEMDYWYQYIHTVLVLNNFSDICMRECGADFDSDTFMTTDNPVLIRKYRLLPVVDCVGGKPKKVIPTEKDYVRSEKQGFQDRIGGITNVGTSQLNLQSKYPPGSREFEELEKRVISCIQIQQAAIDSIKLGYFRPAPAFWSNMAANSINDNDSDEIKAQKEFNKSLIAKKPYFMIYRYDYAMHDYITYVKNANANAIMRFNRTLEDLLNSNNLNEEEIGFVDNYHKYLNVDCSKGVINRICWKIEDEFKSMNVLPDVAFDYHILTSNAVYNSSDYDKISQLYKEYIISLREIKQKQKRKSNEDAAEDVMSDLFLAKQIWAEKCFSVCNDEKTLTNILLDICYKSDNTKQMVWDICSEQILRNLIEKFGPIYHVPCKDIEGDIEYDGEKFKILEVILDEECDIQ